MSDGVIASILNSECSDIPGGGDAEEIIRAVFKKGKNHWMCHTESQAFNASVAVVYLKMNETDRVRMKATCDGLKAINAAISGVPIDVEAVLLAQEGIELFPLRKYWDEVK